MSQKASATRNVQEEEASFKKRKILFEAVFHRLTDLLRNYPAQFVF